MSSVTFYGGSDGIPPADSEELRATLLEILIEQKDTSTAQDLRNVVKSKLSLVVTDVSVHAPPAGSNCGAG